MCVNSEKKRDNAYVGSNNNVNTTVNVAMQRNTCTTKSDVNTDIELRCEKCINKQTCVCGNS